MTFTPLQEGIDVSFPEDTGCLGCSPTNPVGLQLRFRREGQEICGDYTAPLHFAGGPATVHGGILALILDEYSCAAGYFLTGATYVTGSLNVRYEKPAPVGVGLHIRSSLVDDSHPKYTVIEARVLRDGVVIASSSGRFFPDRRDDRSMLTP